MSSAGNPPQRAGSKEWAALGLLVLPALLLFMMLTILFLASPYLAADLKPSSTETLWILDIYGFLMASLLVLMGTVADRFGHRNLLVAGAALFGIFSVLAAMADSPVMMIVWRAVLGIAAAMQMPATLGLIFSMFHDPKQRGVAIGTWAAAISGGVALGPLLAGLLLEAFSWRATFLVAVPVMAIVVIGGPLLLPRHQGAQGSKLDLFSAALLLATLLPLIYGIKSFATSDSPMLSTAGIVIGLALGIWFILRQLRSSAPLLDVRLFTNRTVGGALGVFILAATGLGGVYLMFTQFLQQVKDLSPLQTGFAILPAALVLIAVATLSPVIARRVRPGYVIATGLAVQVIGYLLFTQVDSETGLPMLIAGFVVLYPAVSPSMALTTDLVVSSVPPEKAGAAGGLASTVNDLGISLGVAIVGSIGTAAYSSGLADKLPEGLPAKDKAAAEENLSGAVAAAQNLPDHLADPLLRVTKDAFAGGLSIGSATAAVIAAAGAIIAALTLRHVPPTGAAAPGSQGGEADAAESVASAGGGSK
ncbi:MFS transporter [Streptomyces botrytidirepellens]|uniref:MFS transporter n=1 Tax=Streptomyces botrytidirepellens TaxID=2486417 RepID=A0A3M8S957_9ACTN|nr:MFS transporter [Streptomyces botrytidirepellens]RNF77658.1 MFS transporter [Streptomyces botrytidirepellens]